MKILLVIFGVICAAHAAPMTFSENNIGDIQAISVHANGVLSNNIEANIAQIFGALMNQQAVVAEGVDLPMGIAPTDTEITEAKSKDVNLSPEVMGEVQKLNISPEMFTSIVKAFSSK